MAKLTNLRELQNTSVEDAIQRFKEATRSASFNLSFGITEVRLLGNQLDPFRYEHDALGRNTKCTQYTAAELAALYRLIEKGLVVMHDARPELTEQGHLVRQLMILSGHIVLPIVESPVEPDDVVAVLAQGLRWWRDSGSNSLVKDVRLRTVDGVRELLFTLKRSFTKQKNRAELDQPTSHWRITPSEVENLG